jgi:Terminase large subunit, T4likevirus-type, N-terminal
LAGRGFGKTKAGAEWVRDIAEKKIASRIALVAPTAADARDVMIEGESGILNVCPPWNRPHYEKSKRRLTWPNGVTAYAFSAEEPDRLRGPQFTHAWIDEPGAWQYPTETYDMLMFGLRLGDNPQLVATTTPRPTKLIKGLVNDPSVHIKHGTTYENRPHLAKAFFDTIIAKYEGTRLGEQELNAELLEVSEGAWFPTFSKAKHVSLDAEYQQGFPVRIAIDSGVSRYTGAIFFQVRPQRNAEPLATVFADYLGVDIVSADNAQSIIKRCTEFAGCWPEIVRLDPAATARTSIGPAAYGEYERIFGSRVTSRWPGHSVADGLDQIEIMLGGTNRPARILIHPRCEGLIAAFQNYRREERDGEFLDKPVDPQHPHEDYMDAFRGGIRDAFPEGRPQAKNLRTTHAASVL